MAKFKRSPGCGSRGDCCGPGGGPCLKFVPYVAPFIESGDFSARFSNWNLSGLNQFNTFESIGEYGWLRVVAYRDETGPGFPLPTDTYIHSVKLYKHPTVLTSANLVASWSTTTSIPSNLVSQTINFTEENGSGVTGSVDYDSPLSTSFSQYLFGVRGTNTECDLTVNSTGVSTVTWQVTAVDDPLTVSHGSTTVTLSNTAAMIRSIAVALNTDNSRCLASGSYSDPFFAGAQPFWTVFCEYDGFPSLNGTRPFAIVFNDTIDGVFYPFAISINLLNTSGVGSVNRIVFAATGDLYDICLEIPPTTITNSYGDEVTIRMDHS